MGLVLTSDNSLPPEGHFEAIVSALLNEGWIVVPGFLSVNDWLPLFERARAIDDYAPAGVGRGQGFHENTFVRNDEIHWLRPGHGVDSFWLKLMEQLRRAINQRLFLGLFEYESHYACYTPGSFYKRHLDAFKGQGNRIVSVVLYLNLDWQPAEGGDLVLYGDGEPSPVLDKVAPCGGTLAVFLSEDFPHEVLPAGRTRYSIAGWFRMNATTSVNLDPPA